MQLLTTRLPIRKEIDQGNIQPVFDQNARTPATSNEPSPFDTRNIRMKRATTQQKYEDAARAPAALERILAAYRRGLQQKENAANWSDIGQVQKLFIREFGPEHGQKEFEEFAASIAATTAGADPEANFLMAHFARFMKAKGLPLPKYAYDVPYPAGGRYVIPNFAKLKKLVWDGDGITPANPKVYNLLHDLLGHYSSPARRGVEGVSFDGPMIDERISRLFHPDMRSPPRGSYGHFQAALVDLAKQEGVDTQLFRDLVWAGASPDHPTKSLIQIINESIERTHRITGMARDEIVRRGLLRAEIPLYGIGGGMLVAPQLIENDDDKS
jgi:hypothetical protein